MNGVHDMGGMHGFGKVEPEADEPVFHSPWEGRVLAMNRAMGWHRLWTIDAARFARETLPPAVYLASSYYRKWTLGLENQCLRSGLVSGDELAAGRALDPGKPLKALTAAEVPGTLSRGTFDRPPAAPAKFAPGDRIRTRNVNPPGHTRLPRYARGRSGVIESIRGCHVFPDTAAGQAGAGHVDTGQAATGESGGGQDAEAHWLYTVVFDGRELWGDGADTGLKVSIDAWEPYLEAEAPAARTEGDTRP
jgi:nitrile hydratase